MAAITFVWKVYEHILEWVIRTRERRLSVIDEFWYRTVLYPLAIEPLIKLFLTLKDSIVDIENNQEAGQSEYKILLECFQKQKNDVVARSLVLEAVSSGLYKIISENLDQ